MGGDVGGRKAQKLRGQDRCEQDFAHIELMSFEVTVAPDRSHARVTLSNDSLDPVRTTSGNRFLRPYAGPKPSTPTMSCPQVRVVPLTEGP